MGDLLGTLVATLLAALTGGFTGTLTAAALAFLTDLAGAAALTDRAFLAGA